MSNYPQQVEEGYCPAPLDNSSIEAGIAKFDHGQILPSVEEMEFALGYLNYLFPLYHLHDTLASDDEILLAFDAERRAKTAGFPFAQLGCPTKGQALDRFGLAAIQQYYREFTDVLGCTLKDEIRPVGKKARLFRPQSIASYVEAFRLFQHGNEYLMSNHDPLFIKFQVPGPDIVDVFSRIARFSVQGYGLDGDGWDARFCLFAASVICAFRSNPENRDDVYRYYCMMYNGYTRVGGFVYYLPGQPSGHFNTTVDNALCHCVFVAIHSYRNGIRMYAEIAARIQYAVCGDDMLYSTIDPTFTPDTFATTYNSLGVGVSFERLQPTHPFDLCFVGHRIFSDRGFPCASLDPTRAIAKSRFRKKKRNAYDHVAKLSSMCQLTYGSKATYDVIYQVMINVISQYSVSLGPEFLYSIEGLVRASSETTMLMIARYGPCSGF